MTRFIVTLIQLYHLLAFSSWYQKLIPMDSTMIWRDQTIIYNLTWNIQINITSSSSSMNRAPLRLWNSQLTIRKFPIQSMFLGNTKNIASCTLPSLLVLVILKQWNMYIWIPAHLLLWSMKHTCFKFYNKLIRDHTKPLYRQLK